MGGKRARTREFVYLCLAGLIFLSLSGCTGVNGFPWGQERCNGLQDFRPLIDRGDYEGAAKMSEKVLAASPRSPLADEALFSLGLVYAAEGNPKKDYRKSRDYFVRLGKEYPGSPLAWESKIWIGVLETIEKTKQIDIQIEEKKKIIGK